MTYSRRTSSKWPKRIRGPSSPPITHAGRRDSRCSRRWRRTKAVARSDERRRLLCEPRSGRHATICTHAPTSRADPDMRSFPLGVLLVGALVQLPSVASAQGAPAPAAPAIPPPPPPAPAVAPPPLEPAQPAGGGSVGASTSTPGGFQLPPPATAAGATAAGGERPSPVSTPGLSDAAGLTGTPNPTALGAASGDDWRFSFHGFTRAPLRVGIGSRPQCPAGTMAGMNPSVTPSGGTMPAGGAPQGPCARP